MDSSPKPWLHIYSPLLCPDSIRLLELDPAAKYHEPLSGSLIVTTLEEVISDITGRYTALSYVWGDPTPAGSIIICGCDVGITANLAQALRDVRHTSRVVLLWADALCINQYDTQERRYQVRIMGDIYRGAASTIIYLGPLRPNVRCLFNHIASQNRTAMRINSMGLFCQSNSDSELVLDPSSNSKVDFLSDSNVVPENSGTNTESESIQLAIHEICSSEWFTRAWVFQELVLSIDPRIQCGRMLARWSDVADAVQNTSTDSLSEAQRTNRDLLLQMNKAAGGKGKNKLSVLIRARAGSHVTDPRDFFYCLMGIADDHRKWEDIIQMDYDIPIGSLYASVAHRLIDLGEVRLQELPSHHAASQGSPIQSRPTNRSFLPSWVPDWNVQLPQASVPMIFEKDVAGYREGMKTSDVLNDVLVIPLQRRPGRIEKLSGLVPAWPIVALGIEPLLGEILRPLREYDEHGFMQLSQIPCSIHFNFLGAWLAHLRASHDLNIAENLENKDLARERADLDWLINMIQSTCQRNQAMRDNYYDMRNHYDISNNYNAYSYYRRKGEDNSTREWEKLLRISDLVGEWVSGGTKSLRLACDSNGEVVAVPAESRLGDDLLVVAEHPANPRRLLQGVAWVGRRLSGYEAINESIVRYATDHFYEPSMRSLGVCEPIHCTGRNLHGDDAQDLGSWKGGTGLRELYIGHFSFIGVAVNSWAKHGEQQLMPHVHYAVLH